MPRAKLLKPPGSSPIFHQNGVIRMLAGSMGAPSDAADTPGTGRPEPGSQADAGHDAWEAVLAQREAAQGIAQDAVAAKTVNRTFEPAEQLFDPQFVQHDPVPRYLPAGRTTSDLSTLPDHFTLEIHRRPGGWWKVTAPCVHVGLFVARQDLPEALADVPAALAEIVRLDGIVERPKVRVRKQTK